MADISKIKLPGEATARTLKDEAVRQRVTALENAGGGISTQYNATLTASGWTGSGPYTYTLSVPNLTCGNTGNVSPIISYTSNMAEYSLIDTATATAKTSTTDGYIVFSTKSLPENDIGILIIDVK